MNNEPSPNVQNSGTPPASDPSIIKLQQDLLRLQAENDRLRQEAQALRQNQILLQAVINNAQDPIYVKDRQGRILLANPALARIAGKPLEEIIGRTDSEYFDNASVGQSLREHDLEVMRSGKSEVVEEMINTPDGRRYFLSSKSPFYSPTGEIQGIIGISHDVTEYKKVAQELRQSEKKYHDLVQYAPAGIYEVDFRTRKFTSVNEVMSAWLGYSHEELLAMSPLEILDAPSQRVFQERLARWMAGEKPDPNVEYRVIAKDGREIYAVLNVTFTRDADGKPKGATVIAHDITERRKAEQELRKSEAELRKSEVFLRKNSEALRESEERFRVALSSLDVTVFTQDRDLRYTWMANPHMGLSDVEALGKRDDELHPPETVAEVMAAKQSVLAAGQGLQRELKVFRNGEWRYHLFTLEPTRDSVGNITGLIGASQDVTAQRQMEEAHREAMLQIELQRKWADQRERDRQTIARDIHDGPIQSLTSSLFDIQLAKGTFSDPALQLQMDQAAQHLKETIDELRQVVNELRPPSILRFGLGRSILASAEDFRENHPEISLNLEIRLEDDPLSESYRLIFYRIFQEAMTNAARHAQAAHIWITLKQEGDQVLLEVRDDGKGFQVTDDLSELTSAGHFGLIGMKERIASIGGSLEIFSRPGEGTAVRIRCIPQ